MNEIISAGMEFVEVEENDGVYTYKWGKVAKEYRMDGTSKMKIYWEDNDGFEKEISEYSPHVFNRLRFVEKEQDREDYIELMNRGKEGCIRKGRNVFVNTDKVKYVPKGSMAKIGERFDPRELNTEVQIKFEDESYDVYFRDLITGQGNINKAKKNFIFDESGQTLLDRWY